MVVRATDPSPAPGMESPARHRNSVAHEASRGSGATSTSPPRPGLSRRAVSDPAYLLGRVATSTRRHALGRKTSQDVVADGTDRVPRPRSPSSEHLLALNRHWSTPVWGKSAGSAFGSSNPSRPTRYRPPGQRPGRLFLVLSERTPVRARATVRASCCSTSALRRKFGPAPISRPVTPKPGCPRGGAIEVALRGFPCLAV
jgi:hypothetical protein